MGFSFKKLVKQFDSSAKKIAPGFAQADLGAAARRDEEKKKSTQNAAMMREREAAAIMNQQAENLRRNLGIDLQTNNVANIEAGGSAMLLDEEATGKKRRGGGGAMLSSTLGIR